MTSLDYRSNPLFTFKECSSCGALHNKSCVFSKGGFVGKFVRDPNKTPDSSQRPPPNCPKCGDPVDGLYCRQCALLRKKLEEVFQDFQDTSKSSNDNTNVVNAPQEPFAFNQDPGENSSQIPICYDDDDDEESSIPLKDIIISGLPSCVAITSVLLTEEPVDSLIMEDEHLDTIPATESDEVIKSSVEDLVSILILKNHFEIFINSNNDDSSSDDNSLYGEDIDYVEASPSRSSSIASDYEDSRARGFVLRSLELQILSFI
ncbi:hypothetical protein Tco_0593553 [Tanacetum coccineum]